MTGAAQTPHSGSTLLEHLSGVHAILRAWKQDDDVCLGGLFHSVYGTQSFRKRSLELNDRAIVGDVIGQKAEKLAYLFCVLRRPFLARRAAKGLYIVNRHDKGTELINGEELRALEVIATANRLEVEWRH